MGVHPHHGGGISEASWAYAMGEEVWFLCFLFQLLLTDFWEGKGGCPVVVGLRGNIFLSRKPCQGLVLWIAGCTGLPIVFQKGTVALLSDNVGGFGCVHSGHIL